MACCLRIRVILPLSSYLGVILGNVELKIYYLQTEFLENLVVAQLVVFPTFHRFLRSITVFTIVRKKKTKGADYNCP
jgi:hypothetical protein